MEGSDGEMSSPRVIDYFLSLWKGNALSSSLLPEQVRNTSPGRKSKPQEIHSCKSLPQQRSR